MSRYLESVKPIRTLKETYNLQASKVRSLMGCLSASLSLGSKDIGVISDMLENSMADMLSTADQIKEGICND